MPVLAVESHLLLEVVWVSLVATIGISVLFSSVIVGSARSTDARRAGRGAVAAAWAALAVICFALFALSVAYGVHVMVTK